MTDSLQVPLQDRINDAVEMILWCGQIDGAHHKMWVLDQVLRTLLQDQYDDAIEDYDKIIKDYCGDLEDEDNYYDWDTGTAP